MRAQSNKIGITWLRNRWPIVLIVTVFALIIFGFPPALPIGIFGDGTRLEIFTDKSEYILGERVNATFYIVNSLPVPVRLEPYNIVEISTFINGIPHGVTRVGRITWGAGAKITIPPDSRHKIEDVNFKVGEAGDLTINLNIYVRDELTGSTTHTVNIKPISESIVYNESDMAEIIRLSLTIALVDKRIPDYRLIKDKENIVLSTENIVRDLVPEMFGVNLIILEPEEIQLKADREGDFLYLRFTKLEFQNDRNAIVHLDNVWMKSKTSPYIGGGLAIAYSKESGIWNFTVLYSWIS